MTQASGHWHQRNKTQQGRSNTSLSFLVGANKYTSLPDLLLPAQFALSELRATYESILGRRLDKSAFRTRMLSAAFIESTGPVRTGPNRPAQLYRLRDREAVFFPRMSQPRDE